MEFSLYREALSNEPTGQTTRAIPMSEAEREETKRRVIEYAEKTLPAFEANHSYLRENYDDLLKQYPDRYVAVYHLRVVASAPSIEEILTMVDQLGFDRHFTLVELLNTDPMPMIL